MNTVTVHINRRCIFSCGHCIMGFSAENRGARTAMTPGALRALVASLAASGCGLVLMAGGEPSLDPELAAAGADACRRAGIRSCITTAPHWAATPAAAGKFLDKVPALDRLVLSYDRFHAEKLRLSHYLNAAAAAKTRGLEVIAQLTWTERGEARRLLAGLKQLKPHLDAVLGLPAVSAGSAAGLKMGAAVRINTARDLDRLPRVCVAGEPLVDHRLGLHGCCFASGARYSPLSLPARRSEKPAARLRRLRALPLLRSLGRTGFLGSLSAEGRKYLAAEAKGLAFTSECDLCLFFMNRRERRAWDYAAAGPGPRLKARRWDWVLWRRGGASAA